MKSLTLLIKPASSLCNMRCRYCFYEDEAENRAEKSMGIMERETVEILIRRAMDYIGPGGNVSVLFQGGEPTLAGAAYFQNFCALAQSLLPRGASIQYGIQTNGYAISDELLAVLKRYRFLVGLSLDGCRALHDSNRVDAAGSGTWHRVLGNLKRMMGAGIQVNALCVITGQAAANAQKLYRTLKQLGLRYHQYILCLDPMEVQRGSMAFSLTPEGYGRFLKDAFDLWYADWKRGDYVSIRTFEDYAFNIMGAPCSSCAVSGRCGQYLVVEADGSAYPCDFYCLDEWKLGSLRDCSVEELLTGARARDFAAQRDTVPQDCRVCPYLGICRTGCFRDWETGAEGPYHYYCSSLRSFFDYALPRLEEIAAAEQRSRQRNR